MRRSTDLAVLSRGTERRQEGCDGKNGVQVIVSVDHGGFTTKIHAVVDAQGLPIRLGPIERFFSKLKHFRRVARYDKLFANYLAVVQLALLRLWLCAYESTA